MVSSRPRARSSRSVNTWPRSVGAQLDLVDREETDSRSSHGLDRGDEVARRRRLDPFLAGDQGNRAGALLGGDAVVDLPRQ